MKVPIGKIGVCACALSLLLNILGLSIPYWFAGVSGKRYLHGGLWETCTLTNKFYSCSSSEYWNPQHSGRYILGAVRAMELLGMVTCFAALVLTVIKEFNIKVLLVRDKILGMCAGIGSLTAGGFMLTGVIVFAAGKDTFNRALVSTSLHAGFGLCIISGVLSVVSGVVSFLKKEGTSTENITV